MRQHFGDIWKPGIGVLGVALSVVALVLSGPRGMFFALTVVFVVWLGFELFSFPGWPRNRLGRDALFTALGAGVGVSLFLALTWSTLAAPSRTAPEPAASRAAASEVLYELFEDGAILKEANRTDISPLNVYEDLKREAFERQHHVLAGMVPFQRYQLIQRFYTEASYPLSWVYGQHAKEHIAELRLAARHAQAAIFPYVDLR